MLAKTIRQKIWGTSLGLGILGMAMGCQKPHASSDPIHRRLLSQEPMTHPLSIKQSPQIHDQSRQTLKSDLEWLMRLRADPTNRVLIDHLAILGIDSIEDDSLIRWIDARIQLLIATHENTALKYVYSARGITDDLPQDYLGSFGKTPGTNASNLGAALFNLSQTLQKLDSGNEGYFRVLVGDTWMDLTTPRIGIIKLGIDFFLQGTEDFESMPSYESSLVRLGILFHEARHSDGNSLGESLGFPHELCPDSFEIAASLRNRRACDSMPNGAYRISYMYFQYLAQSCGECSVFALNEYKMRALDAWSRILPEAHEQPLWDASPE